MTQYPPIPVTVSGHPSGCVDGWRDQENPNFIAVQENSEPLVDITDVAPQVVSRPVYQTPHGEHQLVRRSVAAMLAEAQTLLPDGLQLVLLDGWRSIELQQELYEREYAVQVAKLGRQMLSTEEEAYVAIETQRYVSLPSLSPDVPSPHNTGGAVDVAIAMADRLLDFGTVHDDMSERSSLTYCETNDLLGAEARNNRRMLYYVMTQVGFKPYADEWWHFNYGNQMAQMTHYYRTGEREPAVYGPGKNVVQ